MKVVARFRALALLLAFGTIVIAAAQVMIQPADAATLDFESVGVDGSQSAIPAGYGGFSWTNFFTLDGEEEYGDEPGNGYINGTASGDFVGFNGGGNAASLSRDANFNFISATFAGAWYDGLNVDVAGFRDGVQIYSTTFSVSTGFYSNLFLNWLDIDQLTFMSYGGTTVFNPLHNHQFVIDNFQYSVVTTPVPPAFLLMATALVGLGVAGWRRRNLQALPEA